MLCIQLVEREDCQDKSVEQIAADCPPPGWKDTFKKARPEIELVSKILSQLGEYYPRKKDLFRSFDLTPLNCVKVVIIGQDPYHTPGQADGLCFSSRQGIQPSLNNIYKELAREYPQDEPGHRKFVAPIHGNLEKWAEQGVLLLNTCLTVAPHKAGSHKQIWNGVMTRVLDAINEANPECVFLCWGKPAIEFSQRLCQRAIKLYASHPSPFSAYKASKDAPSFIGCNHFKMTNEYLIKQGKRPIDWTLE